jgi:hypothetical protein
MRYSLSWLLASTAYVAFVVAGISSQSSVIADVVWLLTFAAFCYAVITAFVATDRRRAMALGFALFAAGHFACLFAAESRIPTSRLFKLVGYRVSDGMLYSPEFVVNFTNADGQSIPRSRRQRIANGIVIVRTANAAGTMLAGLIGCSIGALAYRHSGREL